jgi:sugar/nucleoside kinase (ribokinase family)
VSNIVGLGTLAMDVMVQVDRLPGVDGFAVVTGRSYLPGGSGTNVITQAARLGASAAYIGKVGDDQLGHQIIESLDAEGVDTSGMRVLPGGTSLSTTVVVDADGDRFILLDLGDAFGSLTAAEVDLGAISSATAFYTDLVPREAALAGVAAATTSGVPLVFGLEVGLGTMAGLGVSREDVLAAAAKASVFLPCREGLADLCGSDDVEAGLAFLSAHCPGLSIVTLGAEGAVAVTGSGDRISVSGYPVVPVDTTGAGDAFAGAFLYFHFIDGRDPADSIRLANAVAAASCTRLGARSGPDLVGLTSFLATATKE